MGVGGFRIFLLYLAWLHFAFVFHYVLVLICSTVQYNIVAYDFTVMFQVRLYYERFF